MKRFFVIAAIATLATVAQAQQQKASDKKKAAANTPASSTTTAATTGAPIATVAQAGSSSSVSLDAEAQATAGKSWSVTFVSQASIDASQLNYTNNNEKSYGALNYVGGGYKLNKNNRLGLRQYFELKHSGKTNKNETTLMDPVLTYTRSAMGSLLGTDPLTATFWYYAPTSQASRDARSNGNLRMDMEFAWTLSPKWTVSYYFNPRQNFIPEGFVLDDEGKENPVFTKTSLVHYGSLYYSLNDAIYTYANAGYIQRWRTSNFNMTEQNVIAALGAVFTFAGGKIQLNPEINVESKQIAAEKRLASEQIIQEQNVSYYLTSAFVF